MVAARSIVYKQVQATARFLTFLSSSRTLRLHAFVPRALGFESRSRSCNELSNRLKRVDFGGHLVGSLANNAREAQGKAALVPL
jgi:hypothetical protein